MYTSHFPVDAPPCLWLTFRDQPSGRFGSSYIGPPLGCVGLVVAEVEAAVASFPRGFERSLLIVTLMRLGQHLHPKFELYILSMFVNGQKP